MTAPNPSAVRPRPFPLPFLSGGGAFTNTGLGFSRRSRRPTGHTKLPSLLRLVLSYEGKRGQGGTSSHCRINARRTTHLERNDMSKQQPDLTGRQARCSCMRPPRPSDINLPFFEYRGPGSASADDTCHCGFARRAHTDQSLGKRLDHEFEPRGDVGFDSYYCGHSGWD